MMFGLFPVVLIAIVVGVVLAARRASQSRSITPSSAPSVEGAPPVMATPTSMPSAQLPPPPIQSAPAELAAQLDHWVAADLLTREQAAAIQAHELQAVVPAPAPVMPMAPTPARRRRIPPVAEALGYVGGVLTIVGLVLLVAQYWPDMAIAGRLALSGAGAVALLFGGFVVHEHADPSFARLRWFLWLAGTAAAALFVGVMTRDAFDVEPVRQVVIACSATVAVLSGILWMWRERPVQQLTCLAGVAVVVGTLIAELTSTGPAGLAVWGVGAILLVLGLRLVTPLPLLTEAVAAATVTVGAMIVVAEWAGFGLILALITAMALLAIAAVPGLAPTAAHQIVAVAVGGLAMLQAAPSTLGYFGRDAGFVTGLATWLVGIALLYIGGRSVVRAAVVAEVVGGLAIIGGAALTGLQFEGVAPLFGIASALGLVALGMIPGRVLMSILGSLGLLINVPWAIGRFFPGEGRAPLLIMVSGALAITIAVLLTRMRTRFRDELSGTRRHAPHHPSKPGGSKPGGIAPMHL